MRAFPTLRDAEIAYAQLEDRLHKLERGMPTPGSGGSSGKTPTIIQNITNEDANIDSVLNADGSQVLHQLLHVFVNGMAVLPSTAVANYVLTAIDSTGRVKWAVGGAGGGNPFQFIQIKQIPVVPGEWRIGNESNNLILTTSFTDGTRFFDLEYVANANLIATQIFFDGVIGDVGRRVRKLSTVDLSVMPGTGPPATVGYVLRAKDINGNVEWGPSGASGVSQAFSSSNQSYGTSGVYSDVAGCSLNITTPGAHIITASIVTQLVVNDSELHIRAVHNQAGGFFAMSGELIFAHVAAEPGMTLTGAYSWFLTVATVPCIVKLEKMKVGSGSSSIFIESNILAARLG